MRDQHRVGTHAMSGTGPVLTSQPHWVCSRITLYTVGPEPVAHAYARPGEHFYICIPFKIIYLTELTSADITSSTILFSIILSVLESVKHPARENVVSGVSVGVGAEAGAGTGVGVEEGEGAASPVLW